MSLSSKSPKELMKLATTVKGKQKDKTLAEIAQLPNAPSDVLEFLSTKSQRVREALAKNPNISEKLLAKLASDPATRVRAAVAQNSAAPRKILAQLAKDNDPAVRASLARSEHAPSEILSELARDPSNRGMVLSSVASNQMTPPQVLAEIVREEHSSVRARKRGTEEDEMFFTDESFGPLSSAAGNPKTPKEALRLLADYRGNEIEWNLAKNPSTPAEVLEKILATGSISGKRDMALNPSLPEGVALKLAKLGDEIVSANLLSKDSRPAVLSQALGSLKSLRESEKAVLAAAKNPSVTGEWLEKIFEEFSSEPANELVLYRLAKNPACPVKVLRALSSSPSSRVSAAARRTLAAMP
ncbi:MAG: HEAT repeat domain-containing protein [Thermoprotei archaeon]